MSRVRQEKIKRNYEVMKMKSKWLHKDGQQSSSGLISPNLYSSSKMNGFSLERDSKNSTPLKNVFLSESRSKRPIQLSQLYS